jgi:hypothetical protein
MQAMRPTIYEPLVPQKTWKIIAVTTGVFCLSAIPLALLMAPMLPFLLLALPFCIVMMNLTLVRAERRRREAVAAATAQLGPTGRTALQILETSKESLFSPIEMVFNDWGVVVAGSSGLFEAAWSRIDTVDEPRRGALVITAAGRHAEVVPTRYFLVARLLWERLKGRVDLDLDPIAGTSRLLEKLERKPRDWGPLTVDARGLQYKRQRIDFERIQSVTETVHRLKTGRRYTLVVSADDVLHLEDTMIADEAYPQLKAILSERLPGRTTFQTPAPTPASLARDEFEEVDASTSVGFIVAGQNRRYELVTGPCAHLLDLVEQFQLGGKSVRDFLRRYDEVLRATGDTTNRPRLDAALARLSPGPTGAP